MAKLEILFGNANLRCTEIRKTGVISDKVAKAAVLADCLLQRGWQQSS